MSTVSWQIRISQRDERPTVVLLHKREFESWWKQAESTYMTKKRNPDGHMEKRNAVFPVRWKDKSELWLSLLTTPYKTAHRPNTASQAPWQHQAADWTRWDSGMFLTAPPGVSLSGVGWVEKEDHDNSSLSGSSSTLYLKCFQMQKSSLRRNILPGFLRWRGQLRIEFQWTHHCFRIWTQCGIAPETSQ